ncbi:MAG: glycosyltransferase family 2 protein [Deltaproteobacteria bacterium]|nr:glycosyltransferase family 2 protein [Deltaproteobacteria bacterium]
MIKLVFVAAAAWLLYVYAGYPLALVVLAWLRGAGRHSSGTGRPAILLPFGLGSGDDAGSHHYLPSVSVLIAARNEERDIGWKIAETLAWDYPENKLEVLVASDASDDRTDEIVRAIPDPRVSFIRVERRGGKVRALNRLAEVSRGEILFFTDANAHVEARALRRMVRHFADPRVGCVTGDSRPMEEMASPAISNGASVYWGFESLLKSLESRIGSVLVCDGAIFCARAALYRPLHPELANDLELPMRIGAAGYRVTHEPGALVFERDTQSPSEEFARRRLMCGQGMAAMLELPEVLRGLRGWNLSHTNSCAGPR